MILTNETSHKIETSLSQRGWYVPASVRKLLTRSAFPVIFRAAFPLSSFSVPAEAHSRIPARSDFDRGRRKIAVVAADWQQQCDSIVVVVPRHPPPVGPQVAVALFFGRFGCLFCFVY